jgi:hypothetical protein
MQIKPTGCNSSCPFYQVDTDYDCVGFDSSVSCSLIQYLRYNDKTREEYKSVDDFISVYDSNYLTEPTEYCNYCQDLFRQEEETNYEVDIVKDESKCTCVYEEVEFRHPEKCPLKNEDLIIKKL